MLFEVKDRVLLFIGIFSSITVCNAVEIPSGSYEGSCVNECQRRSKDYFYRATKNYDWDYCSPVVGVGSDGKVCKISHQCGLHGESYNWCRTTDGSWSYCSAQYKSSPNFGLTRYGYYCDDACRQYQSSYYFCNFASSWEYCSPAPYKTIYGKQCNPDHYCGKHGEDYYWCYTGSSWDYCSPVENCAYWPFLSTSDLSRRVLTENICTIRTTPSLSTTLEFNPGDSHRITAPRTAAERNAATGIIAMWVIDGFVGNERSGTLYTSGNMRIDLQGMFSRNGMRYANIQVQTGSNTLAGIAVRTGQAFPIRYIRRALNESLYRSRFIYLDRQAAAMK